MSLIHSPLVPKIQMSYFAFSKPAFCPCFSLWFVTAVGHLQWADGMDICGYLGKKWALYSGTPEIWFWSISRQGVTEEQGAAPKFLATSVARDTFCFLHSPLSTWIGVGHFEGLCPHEKTKDKGMDEGASSYLGTCNLLLQSLANFGPKRQHWLTLKVSDCGQVVSWHWQPCLASQH